MTSLIFLFPPQIVYLQTCAQERAKESATQIETHIDREEEAAAQKPLPLPLTSPSHIVKEWTTASPSDTLCLTGDGSTRKVCVCVCSNRGREKREGEREGEKT